MSKVMDGMQPRVEVVPDPPARPIVDCWVLVDARGKVHAFAFRRPLQRRGRKRIRTRWLNLRCYIPAETLAEMTGVAPEDPPLPRREPGSQP